MSSNQFCERHEDDNTGTSQELTVTAIPKFRLEVRIKMESPKGGAKAKYTLPRHRVQALKQMLEGWLWATKDQDYDSVETEVRGGHVADTPRR